MAKYNKGMDTHRFARERNQEGIRKREKDKIKIKDYIQPMGGITFLGVVMIMLGLLEHNNTGSMYNIIIIGGMGVLCLMTVYAVFSLDEDETDGAKNVIYGLVIPVIISIILRHIAVNKKYPREDKMNVKGK